MKKLFLLALALIGFTTISNAQSFKLGIKAGVNFANVSGDDTNGFDGRTGFHAGAVAELGFTDNLALQPEILYSSQGADLGDLDTNIDYLNIPILVKYKFLKLLDVHAGPQFGIQVSEGDDIGDVESFDLSAAVGAGVHFGKFFGQLRYNYGFTDITDNGDAKNSVFQISVGYYFF